MRTLTGANDAPASVAPSRSPRRRGRAPAAVRRADWRFLLPDPVLGRVAYVGPHEPALIRALSALSDALELRPVPGTLHDVVVITRPTERRQLAAADLVAPGGWLYLETSACARAAPSTASAAPASSTLPPGGCGRRRAHACR
jgi:hypothetical protein